MKPSITLLCILLFTALITSNLRSEGNCYYDVIAPVAICDAHTVVSLSNDGTAKVFATDIDDGSYDNCQIVSYQVRRMFKGYCPKGVVADTQFRPYVEFCCNDVGQSITVVMRVTDAHGNYNECMAQVFVQDNSGGGGLICPPDITISCGFWFSKDALYNPKNRTFGTVAVNGAPRLPININDPGNTSVWQPHNWGIDGTYGGGVCGYGGGNVNIGIPEVIDYRNKCGVGIIRRKFVVYGGKNKTDWCYQTITVKDFSYNKYTITWPKDYIGDGCVNGPDDVTPNNLPAPYNKPTIYGNNSNSCSQALYAYDDLVLTFAEGACYKILREWTVIDWCKYQPNNPWSGGIWKHTQVITLKNKEAPYFPNGCHDIEVSGKEANCSGKLFHQPYVVDDCTPTELLKWEYKIDLWSDGSYDITQKGNGQPTADRIIPNGWHRILWTVSDQCGNSRSCSYKINVVDKKAPSPICYYGLSTVVMPKNGMVTLRARDFDASSADNCTPRHKLKFSFSSNVFEETRVFTCDDIGTVPLQIWVHDEYGNKDYCTTYVIIDDNAGVCPEMNGIQGKVTTYAGIPVPGAEAALHKIMPDLSLDNDMASRSDASGKFNLGFGTTQYDRMVNMTRDNRRPLEGISTLDVISLQRHINGTHPITNPYQLYAADIDGNGRVGANDLLLLHKAILGSWKLPGFKGDLDWYFFGEPCEPVEVNDLFTSNICHNGVEVSQIGPFPANVEFKAIKRGDVNGDMVNAAWRLTPRTTSTMELIAQENAATHSVDFSLAKDAEIFGLQFSVNATGLQVQSGVLFLQASHLAKDPNGFTNISWGQSEAIRVKAGEVLFSLSNVPEGMPLTALLLQVEEEEDALYPEIYTAGLKNERIELRTGEPGSTANLAFETRVTPNPFTDYAWLEVKIPAGEPFHVTFYDVNGRNLFSQTYTSMGEEAQIVVDPQYIRTPGVYYYRVTSAIGELSGKFVKQ